MNLHTTKKKSSSPLISILMPCYNYGHYIDNALQSVLKSTYKNFEIILVDDGSDDKLTIKKLQKIKHKKIRLFRQANQGAVGAFNAALSHAKGKYIMLLSPDDAIDQTYLSKGIPILENNSHIGFVYSYIKVFGDQQLIWHSEEPKFPRILYKNSLAYNCIMRRTCFDDLGPFRKNVQGIEDWDYWIRIAKSNWKGHLLTEPLFFYRDHKGSLSDVSKKKNNLLKRQLRENHKELYSRLDWKIQWFFYEIFRKAKKFIFLFWR